MHTIRPRTPFTPTTGLALTRRKVSFRDDREKLAFMQAAAKRDARHPAIIAMATKLARCHRPDDWLGQVNEIHRFVRDGIRYQHDPDGHEELAEAAATLVRGHDDCDGKARLAVALARALAIEAELNPVWKGPILAHVQARYKFPGSERLPGARPDGWIVGELTVGKCEIGDDPWRVEKNPATGRLPLS